MQKTELNLLLLHQCSILEQLRLEEALLRADQRNWCLIHQKPLDAIVMGISAQPEQVIDYNKFKEKPVPVIRRFSGGGTVFIDEGSLMVTFICNEKDLGIPCFPQPVLQWSETFYQPLFADFAFSLRENDYAIGHRKCGGNAQYMTKNRWVHHTSFLWDYCPDKMDYLKMPPKMPQYRQNRTHSGFLCKLKEYFSDREDFSNKLLHGLDRSFKIYHKEVEEAKKIALFPHRQTSNEHGHSTNFFSR